MSHGLEIKANGNASMFYLKEVPWHGLGVKLEEPPTAEQAILAAGLDWKVGLKPVAVKEEKVCDTCAGFNEEGEPNCGNGMLKGEDGCLCSHHESKEYELGEDVPAQAVFRLSDNRVLGVVGPNWHPLQNVDAFAWFDPFVKEDLAVYHTAGSLRQGQIVWILAEIKDELLEVVPGDALRRYILLSNSHDGTQSVRAGFTTIRVVCANTLGEAHAAKGSRLLRVKHTQNLSARLELIRDIMQLQHQSFAANVEQYRFLTTATDINQKDVERYVRLVFCGSKDPKEHTKGQRIINAVMEFFYRGRGSAIRGVKGTMWAAYNAITEHLAWSRGRSADNRLTSGWFGDGANINQRALAAAVQITAEKTGNEPPVDIKGLLPPKNDEDFEDEE